MAKAVMRSLIGTHAFFFSFMAVNTSGFLHQKSLRLDCSIWRILVSSSKAFKMHNA